MRARLVSAAGITLAGSFLLVSADAWDALAGVLGLVAWALAVVASGAVLSDTEGRGALVLGAACPVLSLAVCLPFSRAEEPFTWAFFAIPVLGVAGAALTTTAAWATRRLRRRSVGTARAAEGVAMTAALVTFGSGVWLDQRVVDRHPARPVPIDDVAATFRGVGPGDRVAAVERRLGPGTTTRPSERGFAAPLGRTLSDFDGPTAFDAEVSRRYRGFAVLVGDDRVAQVIVTDRDAETAAGVGIGDSLEVARRAYARLTCDGAITGSDATNPAYPYCRGHLAGRSGITFYGDPIESITLDDGVTGPRLTRR